MNKTHLMGRLTKDPEIRYTQSAEPVCIANFTLAVDKKYKSKKEGAPTADFIPCTAFGGTAEFVERNFKKSMMVIVHGGIDVSTFEKDGQPRWVTKVNVNDVDFGETKAAFEARMAKGGADGSATAAPDEFAEIGETIDDEDLPF